jgi:N-acetylmuramoyl-L-alanine amidase
MTGSLYAMGWGWGLRPGPAPSPTPVMTPRPIPPKPPVVFLPSPNQDERPTGMLIDCLVIHDTESPGVRTARHIANHFLNPRSQVSAHYIIGKDGEVVQCVEDDRRAWHAGPSQLGDRVKVNDFSIGIELVNAQTGNDPFTDAQYDTLNRLVAHLVAKYNIPKDRIVGHKDITHRKSKNDPAENFDWNRFLAGVDSILGEPYARNPRQK